MSNGDPPIHALIAEAHAARAAGDITQMNLALDELHRVMAAQQQPEQEAADAVNPDLATRALGGVEGAVEGVGDLAKGVAQAGVRVLKDMSNPLNVIGAPVYLAKQGVDAIRGLGSTVSQLRDVTQRYRAGEASPEAAARSATGAAGAILGTLLGIGDASGLSALDRSPSFDLSTPLRSLGRNVEGGFRNAEKALAPGRAIKRATLRAMPARAEAVEARTALTKLRMEDLQDRMDRRAAQASEPPPPPDPVLPGGMTESSVRASLQKQGFQPDAIARVIAEMKGGHQPSVSSAAEPIPPGPPQTLANQTRALTDDELAAQPLGQTPPLEQSGAAPGNLERQVATVEHGVRAKILDDQIAKALANRTVEPMGVDPTGAQEPHPMRVYGPQIKARSPFTAAPEGGVQRMNLPGRRSISVPLDPRAASHMLTDLPENPAGAEVPAHSGLAELFKTLSVEQLQKYADNPAYRDAVAQELTRRTPALQTLTGSIY